MTTNLLDSDVPSRLLFEALKCYEQDWNYVSSGLLNMPWDNVATASRENDRLRLQLDHKQSNPLFALSETGRVIRESIGIFSRRNKFAGQPSGQVWFDQPANGKSSSVRYPDYYLNDFHYQTDGWLSSESANTYEASTETLFLGRQDAMQRQTLIPLLKHFKNEPPKNILEIACGTGRFATFVRDNFPQANMTISDLSPFYLEKARENDKYWRDYRGEKALQERTPGIKNEKPKPAKFVQANAEELPFPDETFDAVTCVYLFHELPLEARENAAKEMARVLKPGGMVSFTDSIQLGDRPALDKAMGNFARLNEPHYQDYMQTYLAPLFEKHGLTCSEKYVSSTTKTLSFIKPESLVERAGNYANSFE
jgi:ubiquinone/menaquinone biosynthesis C-methylase UbiE